MKWIKRVCWLTAWGVWVWMGVGLKRELPCRLGPVVCNLSLQPREWVLGYLPDFPQVVTRTENALLRVYDATSGAWLRTFLWVTEDTDLADEKVITRHGVAIAKSIPGEGDGAPVPGLYVLDLKTGSGRNIASTFPELLAVHPDRPWVLYHEPISKRQSRQRLVAYDFASHVQLIETEYDDRNSLPFFVPETDWLVIPKDRASRGSKSSAAGRFELWRLGGPAPMLERVVKPVLFGHQPHPCMARRVAYARGAVDRPIYIDVIDVETGETIQSAPPIAERQDELVHSVPVATFSASGKAVLNSDRMVLTDVGTGRVLWRSGEGEGVFDYYLNNAFLVSEEWQNALLRRWLGGPLKADWTTIARRDLETGRTLQRYWATDFPAPYGTVGPGGLAVSKGSVHGPPQNWPLLALCQTILALPLVLLWAALRWRRKRRMHLADATP